MAVTYEFVVETLDYYEGCGNDPDIIETNAFDTLKDATKFARSLDLPWRVCLRRISGNDLEGIIESDYAYPNEMGALQSQFESATGFQDGPKVPERYRNMTFPIDAKLP